MIQKKNLKFLKIEKSQPPCTPRVVAQLRFSKISHQFLNNLKYYVYLKYIGNCYLRLFFNLKFLKIEKSQPPYTPRVVGVFRKLKISRIFY